METSFEDGRSLHPFDVSGREPRFRNAAHIVQRHLEQGAVVYRRLGHANPGAGDVQRDNGVIG